MSGVPSVGEMLKRNNDINKYKHKDLFWRSMNNSYKDRNPINNKGPKGAAAFEVRSRKQAIQLDTFHIPNGVPPRI